MLDMLSGFGPEGLSVQALCRTGAIMGISESNVRVALTRLVQQRKIRSNRRGSYAIDAQDGLLLREVDDWWQRESRVCPWSGAWIAVQVAPGSVNARSGLRRHEKALALRGFQRFRPGLHLRPDNLAGGAGAVRGQLLALGLSTAALVFRASEMDPHDDAAARTLWPVEPLRGGCRALLSDIARSKAGLDSLPLEAAAREVLLLGRLAIRHILHDPLLPGELMPGDERRALISAMRDYQLQARQLWVRVLGS